MKKESFLASLGSSILWKGLDKASGLIKHIVIASAIGLSAQLDVFYLATALLGVLVFSWGNLLDVLAVPHLIESQQAGDKERFNRISGGLFSLCILFSLFLALIILLGRAPLSGMLAGLDADRSHLLSESFIWLLPVVLLFIPLRFLGALFRATRQFTPFYQGEFIIALSALLLIIFFRGQPAILLWSLSVGMLIAFAYLFFLALRDFKLWANPFSPEVKLCLTAAPGLLVLQAAQYVYQLSDRFFMSYLPIGAVGALAYGWTLASLFPGIIGIGGSFITIFKEKRQKGDNGQETINNLISLGIFLGVPAALFLLVFGGQLIAVLLERGVFTSKDTAMTASALSGYALAMIPLLLLGALDQVFQVLGHLEVIAKRTIYSMVINVILNSLFLFWLKWGVLGIALATSLSYLYMFLSALQVLQTYGIKLDWKRHIVWLMLTFAGAVIAGAGSYLWTFTGVQPWLIVPQAGTFAVIMLGLALLAPGFEGHLVRRTMKRIVPWSFA